MTWSRTTLPVTATVLLLLSVPVVAEQAEPAPKAGAVVKGVVRFDGPRPKRRPIQLREKGGKLSDCHKLHEEKLLDEKFLVSEQGQLANVFVYVKKGLDKKNGYPVPEKPAVLNQDKCMFRPRVQGVLVGQEFVMRNGDPLLHNIRSFSLRNRAFNIAQPADSDERKKVFKRREKAIKLQCDIHPWMTAWYFVMEHPYFAVTDAKGRFRIKDLPPGKYTLAAWHEELGEQDLELTVGEKGLSDVAFSFEPKKDDTAN